MRGENISVACLIEDNLDCRKCTEIGMRRSATLGSLENALSYEFSWQKLKALQYFTE